MEPTKKDEFEWFVLRNLYHGETVHIFFVERKNYAGVFLPGYKQIRLQSGANRLKYIDHMVECRLGNEYLG
jgi:4-hydroxyphenylpyruvate dioxygenase